MSKLNKNDSNINTKGSVPVRKVKLSKSFVGFLVILVGVPLLFVAVAGVGKLTDLVHNTVRQAEVEADNVKFGKQFAVMGGFADTETSLDPVVMESLTYADSVAAAVDGVTPVQYLFSKQSVRSNEGAEFTDVNLFTPEIVGWYEETISVGFKHDGVLKSNKDLVDPSVASVVKLFEGKGYQLVKYYGTPVLVKGADGEEWVDGVSDVKLFNSVSFDVDENGVGFIFRSAPSSLKSLPVLDGFITYDNYNEAGYSETEFLNCPTKVGVLKKLGSFSTEYGCPVR